MKHIMKTYSLQDEKNIVLFAIIPDSVSGSLCANLR